MALWLPFLLLFGCASAVLVGGGKDDAPPYPNEGDARISRDVSRRLVDAPQVRAMDVEVHTREGVVTLSGQVPSRAAAEEAERLASSVPGVRDVRNRLRVGP
jgi:osmotically-inducible protein OsmY